MSFSQKMEQVLADLGVTSDLLTEDERKFLDEQGYLVIRDVLSPDQGKAFSSRLDELVKLEWEVAGSEVHQEKGSYMLGNLIDKDPRFEFCVTHPKVLAAIAHVLQKDFKHSSLNSREALPGDGLQRLHEDYGKPIKPGEWGRVACNSIWLLDDFNKTNGATRVVPGSHRKEKLPQDAIEDIYAAHPDEIQLIAPAGTVVVFNAHLWHGGSKNESSKSRHAMHCFFCQREDEQQTNQREHLRPETVNRLSNTVRWILDVD